MELLQAASRRTTLDQEGWQEKERLERLIDRIRPPEEHEWDIEIMRSIAPRKTYRVKGPDEEIASQRALELARNDDWTGAKYGEPDYEIDGIQPIAPQDVPPRWTEELARDWVPRFMAKAAAEGYTGKSDYAIGDGYLGLNIRSDGSARVASGEALGEAIRPTVAILTSMEPVPAGWRYHYVVPCDTVMRQGSLPILVTATTQ